MLDRCCVEWIKRIDMSAMPLKAKTPAGMLALQKR
jgi:hypothetical protein